MFKDEYFLFSIFPYYDLKGNSKKKRQLLKDIGIHELSNANGRLLLDSGGFQLYKRRYQLDFNETIQIYNECRFQANDYGISLDHCPFFDDTPTVRMEKINYTIDTYRKMVAQNKKVVPVIHGTTRKEFQQSLKQIDLATGLISYPSCFPLITMTLSADEILNNRPSIKTQIIERFVTFLKLIKETRIDEDYRIHVLGATGQNSSHLCWYAGMDQTDSSSWRLKAAYGKIALLGVSEAKVSNVKSTFGVQEWKDSHDKLLKDCECPICKHLSLKQRKSELGKGKSEGFNNRCVHNAWTYLLERDVARENIGRISYRHYLENRFKGTWWLKFLNKVDETRSHKNLDFFLKTPN